MFELKGKRAIITGGAQGLGHQFARRLLQEECRVCITDIDEKKGQEAKLEFQKQFGIKDDRIHFVRFDVTEKEGWNRIWDEAEKILGGKIEILANNAGINPTFGWEKCLDVMSVAATRGVFVAWERMSTKRGGIGGRIINTASVAGINSVPLGDLSTAGYNVSKQGLVALTRYFGCLEEDPFKTDGIKCYALAPYLADTNLVRSSLDFYIKSGQPMIRNKVEIRSVEDYKQSGLPRCLKVEEVGHAFMQAIRQDKNGSVYAIIPDSPLIEFPNEITPFALLVILTAKIGWYLGVEIFRPKHFYAVFSILLFFVIFVAHNLVGLIF